MSRTENPVHRAVLEQFLDSYLVQRNATKTLKLVTDDICSLGIGISKMVHRVAHNKEEFQILLESELQQQRSSFSYSLDIQCEKEIAPDIFLYLCEVTTKESEEQPGASHGMGMTIGLRREQDDLLVYHLHLSELSAMRQEHDFFMLHYGILEPYKMDESDQRNLVAMMKKTLSGGVMGGYLEPGFPLYFINDALLNWLGYTYEEFTAENGQQMINALHPDDVVRVEALIRDRFAQGNEYTVEYRMRKKDGSYIWVRDVGRKTITASGRVAMISIIVDISIEKRKQQSFETTINSIRKERRRIDRMTGLLNREAAELLITQHLIQNGSGALFLIDIDNFKLVNDTKGHPVGDQVLHDFAKQLQHVFAVEAILARLGGDEFIAFLPQYESIDQLRDLADQVLEKSTSLIDEPLLANKLGVSIGIALAPQDGSDFATLYNNVDKAQYYAKRNGKGRYSFYGQNANVAMTDNQKADIHTLRRMVQNVQIDRGAFFVEYETFHKVFQFMERNINRMQQSTQILLFTLHDSLLAETDGSAMAQKRDALERAIRYGLRTGDLMMDFSATQIVVLLVNCNTGNVACVTNRILEAYLQEPGAVDTDVSYEFGSINEITC